MVFPGWSQRQLPEAWGFTGLCFWSGQISPNEVFRPLKEQKMHKDVPAQEGVLGAVEVRDGPVLFCRSVCSGCELCSSGGLAVPPASCGAGSGEGWVLPRSLKLQASSGMQQCFPRGKSCFSCPHGACVGLVAVNGPAAFLQSSDG